MEIMLIALPRTASCRCRPVRSSVPAMSAPSDARADQPRVSALGFRGKSYSPCISGVRGTVCDRA